MNTEALLNEIEKLVPPILENLGLELIEREFILDQGRWILRLYIDREGTPVTIDDCETASRALEGELDVSNLIHQHYSLEVSSPGLNRPLRRPKDFERFAGSKVEIKTKQPIDGRHHFNGILQGLQTTQVVIREGDKDWQIPLEEIKKAKIKYEFNKPAKPGQVSPPIKPWRAGR
ncbi:MAG: hypothetical protein A2W61_01165 [Deltaproteobacteria bacterium RIFCSPLOWO2_01_44_7]|nr:MAG: hypothetical protein A2712_00605 [Deltaproteobacteria bacterium RIFCSPHIGHO2_01_FULL_43_49]OGQ14225.1 MAG: hypothetical protein A3D22_10010 [Deltaproteobacteria bacterium RIFCSPHIGHO2_02_FULL_44_53]OGQ27441.1 MAG: hypothetical protein A3D98_03610 [Deltaproteobacteria bacterium RIFCSPHIGHO2_12_FULL_44_21]OGQ30689.1 MAG: hypothetical protein A2979_06035 [Deltaproteobacteria bacterium RIFCSPLOWO2_01_FULL_45_74]OGQ37722.1 MAG: hypothetical protein A2W61_01165 [Deltaproteobacteria bacterium 